MTRTSLRRPFFALLLIALLALPALAQQKPGETQKTEEHKGKGTQKQKTPEEKKRETQKSPQEMAAQPFVSEALFKGMEWRLVGPFRGGRALAVAGIPGDPSTYYFGAVSGGVWKSSDGGASWQPLFDKEAVSSIGAVAVAPSNHDVLYVGTGEACLRGNISFGNGMYKTTDGGKTWQHIGLDDSRHIGAVIVDPQDANRVFVAALGHAFGSNEMRGIYRTTDGGKNWEKVLGKDENTGGITVVFDPHNANVLYAALYQIRRGAWFLNSGGPGSGLYKSVDGGTTWKQLTGGGLPGGEWGRVGVSVSGADSNRVYALIEAKDGGLYRSDDGGATWTRVNDDERYRQRAWYFTHVFADPQNADTVYVLNTGAFRSTDGGKTFSLMPAPHGDHHGLWIDPMNPKRMINGNDGGVTVSLDGGKSWSTQYNQPTAQFYHVIADNYWPYWLYGAQQDNSTVAIATYDDDGVIGRWDWYPAAGGESGYLAVDPRNHAITYGNAVGYYSMYNHDTKQNKDISPYPIDNSGHGAGDFAHRFQWTEPLLVSVHDPNVLYTAGEVVWKSTNNGDSWQVISPDLTRNDKSKQMASGGNITKDNTGVEVYDTVFTLAESPKDKNLLWAGSDDGLIHITRDGGANWTNVTPKKDLLPEWSMVSLIEASPHDPATAYAAIDRHRFDDVHPYILVTHDYGKTWSSLTPNGIPDTSYVHAVREDPGKQGLLFAGTESGPYVSFDAGAHWQPLQLNLPTTPVHDLVIHDTDLAVATHGRSFWVLDDITPLRQVQPNMVNDDVVFYRPRTQLRLQIPEGAEKRQPVGANPPGGAIFDYYLKSAHKDDEVTLEVLDSAGKVVRKYSSKKQNKMEQPPEWPDQERPPELIPAEAGMNRFAWNLRYDAPTDIPSGAFYAGNGPEGPRVLPGTYTVRLTVGGKAYTQPLEIVPDPRVKVSMADLQKQLDLEMKVWHSINDLHIAVNQIRDVRSQIKDLRRRLDGTNYSSVLQTADALDKKMTPVERKLIQVDMKSSEGNLNYPTVLNEMFDTFRASVESADSAPTQQQFEMYDFLNKQLEEQLAAWKQIQQSDLAQLNDAIKSANIPAVTVGKGE